MIGDRVFREITDNVWDPKRRLEEMDREKVSMQALSTVPVMFSYWAKPKDALDLSRRLNDHIAEVVRQHQLAEQHAGGRGGRTVDRGARYVDAPSRAAACAGRIRDDRRIRGRSRRIRGIEADERARLEQHAGQLEFYRTKEIIARHLPKKAAVILDLGGGPGRYATWLATLGHHLHLVDP